MDKLTEIIGKIEPLDAGAMRRMRNRLNNLTKPLGSLGLLEEAAERIAGITGLDRPKVERKTIVVMCGDHGVTEEGVSAYPAAVTGLMMNNFVSGGAAINIMAGQAGAEVRVVDVGSTLEEVPDGIIRRKVRPGTANMAKGPAMTREEAVQALQAGIDIAFELVQEGCQMIGLGDMGIGNTTPSSALASVFTGCPVSELTGRGTGIDDAGMSVKIEVIERSIRVNRPNPDDALDVLSKVGGLEIAGLAGVVLGAAACRVPVVIDGVISGAAALVASRIEPRSKAYMFASHLSSEPAHRIILQDLGLKPILHLDMRLGEGTGAALAFPIFETALRVVDRMATFADLGLPSPVPDEEE